MFQIKDFQQVGDKIRIVIETDDFTTRLILRFLSEADKFAGAFHYRVSTESRLYSSQKTKPGKMVHARRSRADLLKKYREIPGSRVQRMRMLKEMIMSEGVEITLDRLAAKLKIAFEEEKLHKYTLVNGAIRQGKSYDDIASSISIPKSTVARYAEERKTTKKSSLVLLEPAEKTG